MERPDLEVLCRLRPDDEQTGSQLLLAGVGVEKLAHQKMAEKTLR